MDETGSKANEVVNAMNRTGVGNFSSRRARFTEKLSLRQYLKNKSFMGHNSYEKLYLKIKPHIYYSKCLMR